MTETLAGVSPPEPKEPPGTGPSAEELEAAQAVTSPAAVREARLFVEGVAATHEGGDYDGWEASL